MLKPILNDADGVILTSAQDATAYAERELLRSVPGIRAFHLLAPGVQLAYLAHGFRAAAEVCKTRPPVFVRHINPVHRTLALDGTCDVEALRAAATDTFSTALDPRLSFSVQTRVLVESALKPFEINTALANTLAATSGSVLDIRQPDQVISVVLAEYEGRVTASLGLSLAADNLSAWAGGARRFAREQGQISRAEFKLLEALEVFQVALPQQGLALDLGAAPGGWTRIMRRRGWQVVAVDPAELDVSIVQDKSVRHMRTTAELYLPRARERFDLILNDMRLDARDSARLLNDYAVLLNRGGQALMTCKLPEQHQVSVLDSTLEILKSRYRIAGARQLFHNRSEVTVHLIPLH